MPIRNGIKNLATHFRIVWALLLYFVLFAALITGLSLPFIMPIARAFREAGVFENVRLAYGVLFEENGFAAAVDYLYVAYEAVSSVFLTNDAVVAITTWFVVLIVIFAFRFFLGLYEIPMATVIDGVMSCNCTYGFFGKFFSTLWLSVRYVFAKMLFTILYDAAFGGIVYGVVLLIGNSIALPFVLALLFSVLWALRMTVTSCWAPCVVSDGYGVARGFFRAGKVAFKRFGEVYSFNFVSIILMFAVGVFLAVFTLGAGLVIVLPIFAAYTGYLNGSMYYEKLGKRYYVCGDVFTPIIKDKEKAV